MRTIRRMSRAWTGASLVVSIGMALAWGPPSRAQMPGLPAPAKPASPPRPDPSEKPIPAKGTPGAVFSATSGPIHVDRKVDDQAIRATLVDLLGQYPGVRQVDVSVRDGVVKLDGHVDDSDSLDEVTEFTKKVDGVRLVLNKMKTDAELLTGREMAMKAIQDYRAILARNWLLAILAVAFVLGFGALARVFSRYSETLLSPFFRNALLRSVVGSIVGTLIILSGILLGLSVLNLTHAVVSVLGLASIAGLALGFAFRDIAENFIASMLLGLRRPFQIGDFVTVAGKSGAVLSLDTRATMLITPEGNHVRIPNAVIYKETLVNASTTPTALGTVDVMVPYDASIADALEAINGALRETDGLLREPTPRALVQALEPDAVRIRATYWMSTQGVDGDKLQSDLRLRIKVALQKANIRPGAAAQAAPIPALAAAPVEARPRTEPSAPPVAAAPATHQQAQENLRKDARAAETANQAGAVEPQATPIDRAIHQAEVEAAREGNNLLANGKS